MLINDASWTVWFNPIERIVSPEVLSDVPGGLNLLEERCSES
jgi:hypothetical protein